MPNLTLRDILRLLLVESDAAGRGVIVSVPVPDDGIPPGLAIPDGLNGPGGTGGPEKTADLFPGRADRREEPAAQPPVREAAAQPPGRREEKRFFPLRMDPDAPLAWRYPKLDPARAGQNAYERYHFKNLGCGGGVFYGIVDLLAVEAGAPFSDFPLDLLEFKKGRFSGAGKVCGALVGAAALIHAFIPEERAAEREELLRDLALWYQSAELPVFRPAPSGGGENPRNFAIVPSRAGEIYCSSSLAAWVAASGGNDAKKRKERCARLTAETAARTAEMLNKNG